MNGTKAPPKHRWTKLIVVLLVLAALIGVGVIAGVRKVYMDDLNPVASDRKTVTIVIPPGYSLSDVATLLKKDGIIKSGWAFSQYVRDKQADNDIKAGTYDLSPSQSVQEIVSIITVGKVATNLVTILPGQRLDQIRKTLISSGFSADSVDQALNPSLYSNHPALVDKPADASLEGYLYPESFQKTSSTTAQQIIQESLDEMQKRLTPDVRAAIEGHNLTVYQGIILASIVEQEGNTASDRAQIAQVFLSRLQMGMRLQSDVTAFYGAIIANQPPSVSYDSAYNTYLHDGLPPAPISNVSQSSLNAVAHPAATNYLYFVAGDDGTVYFATTQAEHDSQVSTYCHKQCGQ